MALTTEQLRELLKRNRQTTGLLDLGELPSGPVEENTDLIDEFLEEQGDTPPINPNQNMVNPPVDARTADPHTGNPYGVNANDPVGGTDKFRELERIGAPAFAGVNAPAPISPDPQVSNVNQNMVNPAPVVDPREEIIRQADEYIASGPRDYTSDFLEEGAPREEVIEEEEVVEQPTGNQGLKSLLERARARRDKSATGAQFIDAADTIAKGILGKKGPAKGTFVTDKGAEDDLNYYRKLLEKQTKGSSTKLQQTGYQHKTSGEILTFDPTKGYVDSKGKVVDANKIRPTDLKGQEHRDAQLKEQRYKNRRLSEKQAERLIGYDDTFDNLNQIEKLFTSGKVTPGAYRAIGYKLQKWAPGDWANADETTLYGLTRDALANYLKSKSGAQVSDRERTDLEQVIPSPSDTPIQFAAKLKLMKDIIKRGRKNALKVWKKRGQEVDTYENEERWSGKKKEAGKKVVKKFYSKKSNKTKLVFEDGTEKVVDGKR